MFATMLCSAQKSSMSWSRNATDHRTGDAKQLLRPGHTPQSIGDCNQDIVHAAGLKIVEYLHPEFRTLGVLDPQIQDVAGAGAR